MDNMIRCAIYGAGGFGREVQAFLYQISAVDNRLFVGFLDDNATSLPAANKNDVDDVLIAVANPCHRQDIVDKLSLSQFKFQSLIHPDVYLHASNQVENGCIICSGVKITCNVKISSFCIVNLNTVIGHDVSIGAFSSIMPSANILGGVTIGNGVFVGAGATILQGLTIEDNAIIGAGAVVTRSVSAGQKVVGMPAYPRN